MMTTPIIEAIANFEKTIAENKGALTLATSALKSTYAYREELAIKLQQADKELREKQIEFFKHVQELNGSVDILNKKIKEYCETLKTTA